MVELCTRQSARHLAGRLVRKHAVGLRAEGATRGLMHSQMLKAKATIGSLKLVALMGSRREYARMLPPWGISCLQLSWIASMRYASAPPLLAALAVCLFPMGTARAEPLY